MGYFFLEEVIKKKLVSPVTLLVAFFPVVLKATLLKSLSEVQNTTKDPGREINKQYSAGEALKDTG